VTHGQVPMPPRSHHVVAIDGPSGSGKSTVAKGVALRCGLRYLDTGATYRAVTVAALRAGLDPSDAAAVTACTAALRWDITPDPVTFAIHLDGAAVAEAIRSAEATAAVSAVAAIPAVRELLVKLSRSVIGSGRIVVEGRDIAAVVAPDAGVKVHLIADPAVRAARRAAEQGRSGEEQRVAAELVRRDHLDSTRAADPLTVAPGALVIDASGQTAEAIIDQISTLVLAEPV
jgi:cytidylate kinase